MATSLLISIAFSASSPYLASWREMLVVEGALEGLALPSSAFEETGRALEPKGPAMCMARG